MREIYLRGGLVLSLDSARSQFNPGVVIFQDGAITFVGPARNAPPPAPGTVIQDCSNRIIMPGLVNAHTHSGMSFFRNLLEDLPSADWFRYELEAERYLIPNDIY